MEEPINFGDLPKEYSNPEDARIAIIPVAYDGTSTWIKGADKGPEAIIEASANMELYDIETDSEVYLNGIFTAETITGNSSVEDLIAEVKDRVYDYISRDKFTVVIGGEHSISIGAIRAHSEKYRNITVLQLDAHCDLRDEHNGSRYNHACVMARAGEICPVVQVGIRSMDSSEKNFIERDNIFFADYIYQNSDWITKVLSRLPERIYITIDLDVFDPSVVPSVGTPEPGGLSWYDGLNLLRAVFDSKDVAGFDVVELCPNEENKAPDFLAAKLIYKCLSYKFRG
jgi:agmatinase